MKRGKEEKRKGRSKGGKEERQKERRIDHELISSVAQLSPACFYISFPGDKPLVQYIVNIGDAAKISMFSNNVQILSYFFWSWSVVTLIPCQIYS